MDNSSSGGFRSGFGLFGGGGGGGSGGAPMPDYSQADLSSVPYTPWSNEWTVLWFGILPLVEAACLLTGLLYGHWLTNPPLPHCCCLGTDIHSLVTGMSPLSPYLNVDPRYLIQDTEEFILPTGANKTRGRFELAFFTIGGCCMTGAGIGAVNGLRLGLKETQEMAWSKPRNVQILNMVTRQGALWANTLGSLALLYSVFGVVIEKVRGAEDDLNTMAAGTMTGLLYKSTAGLRGAARGGFIGFALTGLYSIYNNWDHIKGVSVRNSL